MLYAIDILESVEVVHGGDDLVSEESVRVVEVGHQQVHRPLSRDPGKGGRDVTTDPDVLLPIAEHVTQHVEHRLADAHEGIPRAALQASVAEQRDEGRDEQRIERAEGAHAAHRFFGHARIRILQERDERVAAARVVDLPDRGGDVASHRGRLLARVRRQVGEGALGDPRVLDSPGRREHDGRAGRRSRRAVGEEIARHVRGVFVAHVGERHDRLGAHRGVGVIHQPLDHRLPAARPDVTVSPAIGRRARGDGSPWLLRASHPASGHHRGRHAARPAPGCRRACPACAHGPPPTCDAAATASPDAACRATACSSSPLRMART